MDTCFSRLSSQRISQGKLIHPDEVVKWLGAMQAQDYHQVLWAIGVRTHSSTIRDIEQAIEDRKILRTWPIRGTLHFVPSEDAKWMLHLSSVRMLAKDRRRREQLELDEQTLARCREIFYRALQGGRRLSRPDMMKLLEVSGISTQGQRGYHILWNLAVAGQICLGPLQGKQQTFVLLDEWVPGSRELAREEALSALAERYFTSRGPATIHDFAWWAGLTIHEAKIGLELARTGLVSEKTGGQETWMSEGVLGFTASDASETYLLPGFDEYLLGYKDRSAVLPEEYAHRVVPGKSGIFLPFMVEGGRVSGTWKRIMQKKSVKIILSPFYNQLEWEAGAVQAAESYSKFAGLPLDIQISTPF